MSAIWYYADRHGQQQGPVEADQIRALLEQGAVGPSSLLWREGLSAWQPLNQLAGELGVSVPAAPPPMPIAPGGQRVIVAPTSSRSTAVVVIAVVGIGLLFFLGILAAIAIPAYSDYTTRARVAEGLNQASALRAHVLEILQDEDRCPYNGEDGLNPEEGYATEYVEKIVIGTLSDDDMACAIEVTYRGSLDLDLDVEDDGPARVLMYLDEDNDWVYESNIGTRYLPVAIRERLNR